MGDLFTELERLRKQLQLLQQELQELKSEKKPDVPDGWKIIQGSKKD